MEKNYPYHNVFLKYLFRVIHQLIQLIQMHTVLRQANFKDLPQIMQLLNQAKEWMKKNQLNQWSQDYPSTQLIEEDIKNRNSFVLEVQGKIVLTVAVVSCQDQMISKSFSHKSLISDEKCGFATRAAMDSEFKGKGIAEIMIGLFQEVSKIRKYHSIKTMTHQTNKRLQNSLIMKGYKNCGEIFISGTKMFVYEKAFN